MDLNYLDIVIAIPLIWGAYMGFKKGLILELASFVALALGIYGTMKFSTYTAAYLSQNFELDEKWLSLTAFITTFVLIVIVVFMLAKLLDKLLKAVALGLVNRILGLLFGLLKYALILSVLLYFFTIANQQFDFVAAEKMESSLLYEPVQWICKPLLPLWEEYVQSTN
ncbi:MAG: CvpA family protein [Vicingaceae bacterium]